MSKKLQIGLGILAVFIGVVGLLGMAGNALGLHQGRGHWEGRGHWQRMHKVHPHAQEADTLSKLEVKLIDDDGDGIPDRGEVQLPAKDTFKSGQWKKDFKEHPQFREFGPESYAYRSGPSGVIFGFIRCMACLSFLMVLVVVGIFFKRRRKRSV